MLVEVILIKVPFAPTAISATPSTPAPSSALAFNSPVKETVNFFAEVSYLTLYPIEPPALRENLTGIGVPGKGTVNKTLSPVLFLGWFLSDERPTVFPTGKLIDPQLKVKVFFNLPPPKTISYFKDTVFPKIF